MIEGGVPGMAISPSGKRVAIVFVPNLFAAGDSRWRVYTKAPPHNWNMSIGRFYRDIDAIIEEFDQRGWTLTKDDE